MRNAIHRKYNRNPFSNATRGLGTSVVDDARIETIFGKIFFFNASKRVQYFRRI